MLQNNIRCIPKKSQAENKLANSRKIRERKLKKKVFRLINRVFLHLLPLWQQHIHVSVKLDHWETRTKNWSGSSDSINREKNFNSNNEAERKEFHYGSANVNKCSRQHRQRVTWNLELIRKSLLFLSLSLSRQRGKSLVESHTTPYVILSQPNIVFLFVVGVSSFSSLSSSQNTISE